MTIVPSALAASAVTGGVAIQADVHALSVIRSVLLVPRRWPTRRSVRPDGYETRQVRAGQTVLPSPAMLERALHLLSFEPDEVRARVRLVEAPGEEAPTALEGRRVAGVLCHGVLMCLDGGSQ